MALISEVPHNNECQRIQTARNKRIYTNFKHELKHFLHPKEAIQVSHQLGILIDGLWLRGDISAELVKSATAISEMEFALSKLLIFDEVSEQKHRNARKRIEEIATIVLEPKAFQKKSYQVI